MEGRCRTGRTRLDVVHGKGGAGGTEGGWSRLTHYSSLLHALRSTVFFSLALRVAVNNAKGEKGDTVRALLHHHCSPVISRPRNLAAAVALPPEGLIDSLDLQALLLLRLRISNVSTLAVTSSLRLSIVICGEDFWRRRILASGYPKKLRVERRVWVKIQGLYRVLGFFGSDPFVGLPIQK